MRLFEAFSLFLFKNLSAFVTFIYTNKYLLFVYSKLQDSFGNSRAKQTIYICP